MGLLRRDIGPIGSVYLISRWSMLCADGLDDDNSGDDDADMGGGVDGEGSKGVDDG